MRDSGLDSPDDDEHGRTVRECTITQPYATLGAKTNALEAEILRSAATSEFPINCR
jgi:hypothetical protein